MLRFLTKLVKPKAKDIIKSQFFSLSSINDISPIHHLINNDIVYKTSSINELSGIIINNCSLSYQYDG